MFDFPQRTPQDAEINIGFKYPLVNYASHTTQSLEAIDVKDHPFTLDFYIERTAEKEWNYYVTLLMDFNGLLRMETFNGFTIKNAYEDVLYTEGMTNSMVSSAMQEFWKMLEAYTRQHTIKYVPEKWNYTKENADMIQDFVLERVQKNGLISNDTSMVLDDCLKIFPNSTEDFIFRNTYRVIDLLLNAPDFDTENNRQQVIHGGYMTHGAHLLCIKHKCLFNLGTEPFILNMKDSIFLALHVELAMQCMAGQIWNKLKPLMRKEGFSMYDEGKFMEEGRAFYRNVKSVFEPATVVNFAEIPLWDEVLQ
jgi:hypothetical protein